jgi:protein-tyrosine-phosphatase
MVEAASLVIVFDYVNWSAVLDRYPDLKPRLILLGDLVGIGELLDPVDGSADVFHRVYAQISSAIAGLILELTPLSRTRERECK